MIHGIVLDDTQAECDKGIVDIGDPSTTLFVTLRRELCTRTFVISHFEIRPVCSVRTAPHRPPHHGSKSATDTHRSRVEKGGEGACAHLHKDAHEIKSLKVREGRSYSNFSTVQNIRKRGFSSTMNRTPYAHAPPPVHALQAELPYPSRAIVVVA